MLSLQRAFATLGAAKLSQERFMTLVFNQQKRPPIRYSWPRTVRHLIADGWATNPNERPSAVQIHDALRQLLVNMRHGDDSGLEHQKRRSTFLADEGIRDAAQELSTSALSRHLIDITARGGYNPKPFARSDSI